MTPTAEKRAQETEIREKTLEMIGAKMLAISKRMFVSDDPVELEIHFYELARLSETASIRLDMHLGEVKKELTKDPMDKVITDIRNQLSTKYSLQNAAFWFVARGAPPAGTIYFLRWRSEMLQIARFLANQDYDYDYEPSLEEIEARSRVYPKLC